MKVIHLAFSEPHREGCGANIICLTFQMENTGIIKCTEEPICKLWAFVLGVILYAVFLKLGRKKALAERAQKTLIIGTPEWAS